MRLRINIIISVLALPAIVWGVRFAIAQEHRRTPQYLQAMYQELNEKVFENTLPTARLEWGDLTDAMGQTSQEGVQLGALSTLIILVMSAIGGSMFPRFLMSEAMQKAGLLTINAWAIDGFTKVFWRDEPVSQLWPEVLVLVATAVILFAVARRLARRWEYA